LLELPNENRTIVRAFGIYGRKLGEVSYPEQIRDWAKAEYSCALNCIVLTLANGKIASLRLPGLVIIAEFVTEVQMLAINFSKGNDSFVITGMDGKVWLLAT
jgi:hypothetical protein